MKVEYQVKTTEEKTYSRKKNRVWDFSATSYSCTGANWQITQCSCPENQPTATTTVSGVVEWLSKDPIGISGGLNQYVAFNNNPVMFADPWGLFTEADKKMQQIRTFIDASEIAAANSWWASKGFVKTLGAIALHGGHPWSPLDVNVNACGQKWNVNGQEMTSAQFGNYLAGYYAGYSGSQGILAGMYAGGIGWAIAGNIFTFGNYGESLTDAESAPYISAGFIAGSQARNAH